MIAFHFVSDTLHDGRPVPADGEWLEHEGPVVLCESGLHFSIDPFDALQYAPGPTLCIVEVEEYIFDHDKGAAKRRKIIKRIDATELCRTFARQRALSVAHLCPSLPSVVIEYLKTGNEDLRAAAWATAEAAAWAANAAAWAAWAARAAEWAEAEAEAEAEAADRKQFNDMVYVAFGIDHD